MTFLPEILLGCVQVKQCLSGHRSLCNWINGVSELPVVLTSRNSKVSELAPGQMRAV